MCRIQSALVGNVGSLPRPELDLSGGYAVAIGEIGNAADVAVDLATQQCHAEQIVLDHVAPAGGEDRHDDVGQFRYPRHQLEHFLSGHPQEANIRGGTDVDLSPAARQEVDLADEFTRSHGAVFERTIGDRIDHIDRSVLDEVETILSVTHREDTLASCEIDALADFFQGQDMLGFEPFADQRCKIVSKAFHLRFPYRPKMKLQHWCHHAQRSFPAVPGNPMLPDSWSSSKPVCLGHG